MPASLPDDLQDALSLGSVEARAGGTGLDVLEDVVGALARLAVEGGRAVVAQPVVVEVAARPIGERQFEALLPQSDTGFCVAQLRAGRSVAIHLYRLLSPLSCRRTQAQPGYRASEERRVVKKCLRNFQSR